MIPSWAPNAHPLFVHFPIALALVALGADVLKLMRPSMGSSRMAEWLYALAALGAWAAYVSGRVAEIEVFVPGMAHALIDSHRTWALWTASALTALVALRVALIRRRVADGTFVRVALVGLGLGAFVLVQQTAERGGRLVYEQGVGVIPGPVPPGTTGQGSD